MIGRLAIGDAAFRRRNTRVLREAQDALNVAFGAILSAYIGNSLAEIDNRPFDHAVLARFFVLLAVFIVGLCLGNAALLRGHWGWAAGLLAAGLVAAFFAHHEGRRLGFEVAILRLIALCWLGSLMLTNLGLSLVVFLHHRFHR